MPRGCVAGLNSATSRRVGLRGRYVSWLGGRRWRPNQGDSVEVADELWSLVVAPADREHLAVALKDDRFPPAVLERFLYEHEVAGHDLVVATREPVDSGRLVGCLSAAGIEAERGEKLAVKVTTDIRHEATAGGVEPASGKLLCNVGLVFSRYFGQAELHCLAGFRHKLGLRLDKPGRARL